MADLNKIKNDWVKLYKKFRDHLFEVTRNDYFWFKEQFDKNGDWSNTDKLYPSVIYENYLEKLEELRRQIPYKDFILITKKNKQLIKSLNRYTNIIQDHRDRYQLENVTGEKPEDKTEIIDTKLFKNADIIITDPCYIDKWIRPTMDHDTIYGDWSCGVFDKNNKKIGDFCADSGRVCVTDIKKSEHKSDIENFYHTHKHCATIIYKFTGTIKIVIESKYFAFRTRWTLDKSVHIIGVDSKNVIQFKTTQTGF